MTSPPGPPRGRGAPVLPRRGDQPLRAQRDPLALEAGRPRADRSEHAGVRRQSPLGKFVSTYGWRAYALPVLVVLTGVVLYQTVSAPPLPAALDAVKAPPTIGASGTAIVGAPPRGMTEFDASLPTGILPAGGPFTEAAGKTWRVIPGASPKVGEGRAKTFTYTVEVENGVDTASFGGDEGFARMVTETLGNPKSWIYDPEFAFQRVDAVEGEEPDFRVSLTSPMTVREGCGYEIPIETSCYNPVYGPDAEPRVFINLARWVRGATPFQGDIGSYRQYLINHEVGHAIGYTNHEPCERDGGLAPIMMQQTFSTSDNDAARFDPQFVKPDGKTCRFNPWPYPIA